MGVADELQALYDELPGIECKRECHRWCGATPAGEWERARIELVTGQVLTAGDGCADCSMLTPERACSVYPIRPAMCRLWGLMENRRCPYGCEPERVMSLAESAEFMARVYEISGYPTDWPEQWERFTPEQAREYFSRPDVREAHMADVPEIDKPLKMPSDWPAVSS